MPLHITISNKQNVLSGDFRYLHPLCIFFLSFFFNCFLKVVFISSSYVIYKASSDSLHQQQQKCKMNLWEITRFLFFIFIFMKRNFLFSCHDKDLLSCKFSNFLIFLKALFKKKKERKTFLQNN